MKSEIKEKRIIDIKKLDTVIKNKTKLGKIGLKIDVEGYELDVIKGSKSILKKCLRQLSIPVVN